VATVIIPGLFQKKENEQRKTLTNPHTTLHGLQYAFVNVLSELLTL
jgi:hypothetical protein